MRPARSPREASVGIVLEVAVVAEAVANARDVSALRVVAVRDNVLALPVDDLPDLAEIRDVVAHEVVDGRLLAGEVGNGEHAVLRVVAVRGRAVRLVAETDAAVVGVGEIAVGDDARRAFDLLEGDVLAHRALGDGREVVARVAKLDGIQRAALEGDELRTDGMRNPAVLRTREYLERPVLVGERCRHTANHDRLGERAVVGD